MWVLIYIQLIFPSTGFYDVDAQMLGEYEDFSTCAMDREYFILDQGNITGFPAPNTQLVCIRTEDFTDKD